MIKITIGIAIGVAGTLAFPTVVMIGVRAWWLWWPWG